MGDRASPDVHWSSSCEARQMEVIPSTRKQLELPEPPDEDRMIPDEAWQEELCYRWWPNREMKGGCWSWVGRRSRGAEATLVVAKKRKKTKGDEGDCQEGREVLLLRRGKWQVMMLAETRREEKLDLRWWWWPPGRKKLEKKNEGFVLCRGRV